MRTTILGARARRKAVLLRRLPHLVLLAVLLFPVGCRIQLTDPTVQSGTVYDDYLEEPLTEGVQKYEQALLTSNGAVELIASGDYALLRERYFADNLVASTTDESIAQMIEKLMVTVGPFVGYKVMQWSFTVTEEKGRKLLISQKILEFEKTLMYLRFAFFLESDYERFAGFHFEQRNRAVVPLN